MVLRQRKREAMYHGNGGVARFPLTRVLEAATMFCYLGSMLSICP